MVFGTGIFEVREGLNFDEFARFLFLGMVGIFLTLTIFVYTPSGGVAILVCISLVLCMAC